MPWYEVTVKASQKIAVEADSPDEAASIAYEESFDMMDDCVKECEHPKSAVEGPEANRLIRHADLVLPKDGEE